MKNLLILFLLFLPSCNNNHPANKEKEELNDVPHLTPVSLPDQKVAERFLPPSEFVSWVTDMRNGLKREKVINDITFTVQYKPSDFIACVELKRKAISNDELSEIKKETGQLLYFNLTIQSPRNKGELIKYKLEGYQQYDERIKYLSFKMQNDITLTQDGVTVPCVLYHFERAYDVTPFCSIALGFDPSKLDMDKGITFNLNDGLFNKGNIKIYFPAKSFIIQPKLKTV